MQWGRVHETHVVAPMLSPVCNASCSRSSTPTLALNLRVCCTQNYMVLAVHTDNMRDHKLSLSRKHQYRGHRVARGGHMPHHTSHPTSDTRAIKQNRVTHVLEVKPN